MFPTISPFLAPCSHSPSHSIESTDHLSYHWTLNPPYLRSIIIQKKKKVATEKPCYICHRPTVTVLATLKMEDWLYTCDGHLSDPYVPCHSKVNPKHQS